MKNTELSIVVFSCDAYSDLWDGFFDCLTYYWPDCHYECYLINNHKKYDRKGINVINAGEYDWGSRARVSLEMINTKYVLTFLEDYFVCKNIDNNRIIEVLEYVISESVDYYQLDVTDKEDYYRWKNFKENFLYDIPKNRNYWVDTSIAIWNKSFFLDLLGDKDCSAWEFELARNQETLIPEKHKDRICLFDSRLLVSMCPMVIQGKYYPVALKKMKQIGHNIKTHNRQIMTFREVLKHDFKRFFSKLTFARNLAKIIGRRMGYVFMSDVYSSKSIINK